MSRDLSLQSSSLNAPSPKDAQVVGGHTPTWGIRCYQDSPCEISGFYHIAQGEQAAIAYVSRRDHAAFIVKAVNSHEANEAKIAAAVKALTEIVELTVLKGHTIAAAQIIAAKTLSSLKEGK